MVTANGINDFLEPFSTWRLGLSVYALMESVGEDGWGHCRSELPFRVVDWENKSWTLFFCFTDRFLLNVKCKNTQL